MTETHQSAADAPNPYSAPQHVATPEIVADLDWGDHPDQRIDFSVDLTAREVKRLYPRGGQTLRLALIVVIALSFALRGTWLSSLFVLVPVVILLGFVTFLHRSRLLKLTPSLAEPQTGWISRAGMYVSGEHSNGYANWSSLFSVATTKHCLIIRGESFRIASLIIPWSSFDRPDEARTAAESVVHQKRSTGQVGLGHERLCEPPAGDRALEYPQDENCVHFEGPVSFSQIAKTQPGRRLKRILITQFLIALTLVSLPLIVWWLFGAGLGAVALPMAGSGLFILWMTYRHPLRGTSETKVAFYSVGSISPTTLNVRTAISESQHRWSDFQDIDCSAEAVCLNLRGTAHAWIFIAKAQFVDDANFQLARSWVELAFDQTNANE